ncbi:MAG TPA: hypothetical protein VJ184_01935 [Chryseolinea sp.]|nr:hypothetical protein [Chryseolinea sp.]
MNPVVENGTEKAFGINKATTMDIIKLTKWQYFIIPAGRCHFSLRDE